MKTPRITMTDAIMSETQDSMINQYAAHTGAVPFPVSVVSVNEPTTRINAQMIMTVERPSSATIDSFRENDIIDSFTTTMGMLTTKKH
jgi:hypothetical protein